MKKGLFAGWRDVFSFTFNQDTHGKFKRTTIIFAIIMFIIGAAVPVIMAFVQKDNTKAESPVATVHVVNESSLSSLVTDQFKTMHPEGFPDVTFEFEMGTAEEVAKKLLDKPKDLLLVISDTETGFLLKAVLVDGTELNEGDANTFLGAFINVAEVSKMVSSGVPMDKLVLAMSGSVYDTIEAGAEKKSEGEEVVGMFVPLFVTFFLYFVILIYGITMGNAVSAEKTSKLMEMILTMTRPYGLVFGKVLAMVAAAVLQLFIWFGSLIAGFFAGDYIGKTVINEHFNNTVLEVFKLLKNADMSSAFSTTSFILFGVNLIVSILFFSLLAACFGSLATKTEEVSQYMSYFQILAIGGFLGSYMLPLNGASDTVSTLLRIIPVTSAYILPGDILVGNVSTLQGLLYLLLLAAFTVGLIFLVGKVYKNQLFFRGESGIKSIFKKAK